MPVRFISLGVRERTDTRNGTSSPTTRCIAPGRVCHWRTFPSAALSPAAPTGLATPVRTVSGLRRAPALCSSLPKADPPVGQTPAQRHPQARIPHGGGAGTPAGGQRRFPPRPPPPHRPGTGPVTPLLLGAGSGLDPRPHPKGSSGLPLPAPGEAAARPGRTHPHVALGSLLVLPPHGGGGAARRGRRRPRRQPGQAGAALAGRGASPSAEAGGDRAMGGGEESPARATPTPRARETPPAFPATTTRPRPQSSTGLKII